MWVSNSRPSRYQHDALPTELMDPTGTETLNRPFYSSCDQGQQPTSSCTYYAHPHALTHILTLSFLPRALTHIHEYILALSLSFSYTCPHTQSYLLCTSLPSAHTQTSSINCSQNTKVMRSLKSCVLVGIPISKTHWLITIKYIDAWKIVDPCSCGHGMYEGGSTGGCRSSSLFSLPCSMMTSSPISIFIMCQVLLCNYQCP